MVMTRRDMLASTAAGGIALSADGAAAKNAFFELRYIRMRNSPAEQVRRTSDFLSKGYVPAARRAGIGPLGFFSGVFAAGTPFTLVLSTHPSLAAMEAAREKLAADSEFQKVLAEYNSGEVPYVRMESSLLRTFDSIPAIEVPPTESNRPARIFEMRTYESNNETTLRRKIKMFDDVEIAAFRRSGMQPVYFGETIVGPNMPNLTYMLTFDNMAARDKAWQAFSADPEWKKVRAQPELSDALIVSNISDSILRPLAFSDIR
jgi:hypothetical protein